MKLLSIKNVLSFSLLTAICVGILPGPSFCKPLKKPGERNFVVKHSRIVLVPSLNGGVMVGDAADAIEFLDDNYGAKFVYGGGLTGEVYLSKRFAVGLHFDLAFKDIPNTDAKPIRSHSTGLYGLFKFFKARRSNPYIKGEVARLKATLPDYVPAPGFNRRTLELGTFDCFRIAFGLITHTGSRSTIRTELFYRIVSTDGERIPGFGRATIDLSYVGIELAWGFNLVGFK